MASYQRKRNLQKLLEEGNSKLFDEKYYQELINEFISHIDDAKEGGETEEEGTKQLSVTGDVVVARKPVGEPVILEEEGSVVPFDSNSDGILESLRSHIYLMNVEKDFIRLKLAERVMDSSDEVSKLRGLVKEELKIKDVVSVELVRCRSEFQAMAIEKEKFENQCSSMKEVIDQSQTIHKIRHEACGIDVAPGTSVDFAVLQKDDIIVSSSLDAYRVLKMHLEDSLNGLDNLEKSVQDMYFHTVSLSRSAGRAVTPTISKLIQAFESKTHVEDAPEVVPVDGQKIHTYQ